MKGRQLRVSRLSHDRRLVVKMSDVLKSRFKGAEDLLVS